MSKFFINRPIVAMVIAILMTLVGLVAMTGLPIAQFPNIVPPEIKISTTYTGADALTLEQSVATPIEQEMSGVDNMNYMYSINANNGETKLTVNFDGPTNSTWSNYFQVNLYSSTGTLLATRNTGGDVSFEANVPAAGAYYVQAASQSAQ